MSDTKQFTVVRRPSRAPHRGNHLALYEALAETATNGRALKVPLDGQSRANAASRIARAMAVRGYMTHTQHINGSSAMTVWCERKLVQS